MELAGLCGHPLGLRHPGRGDRELGGLEDVPSPSSSEDRLHHPR